MRKVLPSLALSFLALAIAGCESLLEPQARVSGGWDSPTIGQAQAMHYNGPRARIAVINFVDKTAKGYPHIGEGLADMLSTELFNTGRYIVLERQDLGAVLAEQDLARSGRVMPDTEAPTGQIEGAELLVKGSVTAFEPNYQGGGLGAVLLNRRHPAAGGGKIKQAYIALDLHIVDARTSRIVAAVPVEGRATDIAGALGGVIGGGSSRLGLGLGAYRNTPMEKAVRVCLQKAVAAVVAKTPQQYYHYPAQGQPAAQPAAAPQTQGQPAGGQQPVAATPQAAQPAQGQPGGEGGMPEQVYVSLGSVRVYERPDPASATVATLSGGTALRVAAQQGDWYAVQLPDGKTAWILKAFTSTTQP
ncbi:MAG: CsgG/HfaB family protein [Candidatus Brocadiia bacterium]